MTVQFSHKSLIRVQSRELNGFPTLCLKSQILPGNLKAGQGSHEIGFVMGPESLYVGILCNVYKDHLIFSACQQEQTTTMPGNRLLRFREEKKANIYPVIPALCWDFINISMAGEIVSSNRKVFLRTISFLFTYSWVPTMLSNTW